MCQSKGFGIKAQVKFIILILWALLLVFPEMVKGHTTEVISMDEVVVTSNRLEGYIKNHPQDIERIEQKEIRERNLLNLEEILKALPGVQVYSTPGRGARISIRGSGRSGGVLIMLNGRPLNANQYGAVELDSIPADIIESVTVFKPPVPSWSGPGGSDGVIYIMTRSETVSKDSKGSRSFLKLGTGSFGLIEGGFNSKFAMLKGDSLASITGMGLDGKRTNSDKAGGSVNLNWNRELKDGNKININARNYYAEHGAPGPLDNPTPEARQGYKKLSTEGRYSGPMGQKGTYTLNFYGDIIRLKDRSQSGPTYKLDNNKIGLRLDSSLIGPQDQWELRLGGMTEYDNIDHDLTGRHHRWRKALSSQLDRRFGAITMTIGGRLDHTNDFNFNFGLSSGLGWAIREDLLLKVKAGYAVNIPSFEQLYQTSHGSIDQTRGNPDLNKERVWNHSLGLEYKRPKENKRLEITLFRADIKDLITFIRGTDLIYRPVNINSAYRYGLEFIGSYAFEKTTIGEFEAVFQDSSNSETHGRLPYTPILKAKVTLRHTVSSSNTMLEGNIRYEGALYSQVDNLPTQRMGEFVVVDLKTVQPLRFSNRAESFYVNVYNLFDERFEIHHGYPDDGIRFITGIQINL